MACDCDDKRYDSGVEYEKMADLNSLINVQHPEGKGALCMKLRIHANTESLLQPSGCEYSETPHKSFFGSLIISILTTLPSCTLARRETIITSGTMIKKLGHP